MKTKRRIKLLKNSAGDRFFGDDCRDVKWLCRWALKQLKRRRRRARRRRR